MTKNKYHDTYDIVNNYIYTCYSFYKKIILHILRKHLVGYFKML